MFALRTHLVSTVAGTSPDVQPVPTPLLEPAAATEEEGEEVMTFSRRMEFFLDDKWAEEDGDGFNLIIIDERRRLCQERMEEYLKDFATDGVDSMGKPLYWEDDLDWPFSPAVPHERSFNEDRPGVSRNFRGTG